MITYEEIEALRKMEKRVTPGSWKVESSLIPRKFCYFLETNEGDLVLCELNFLVAARSAIPKLLDEVETLIKLHTEGDILLEESKRLLNNTLEVLDTYDQREKILVDALKEIASRDCSHPDLYDSWHKERACKSLKKIEELK